MKISKELSKGSTALLILSVIDRQDMYGYQIAREIERLSDDVFSLGEGTLYPILHALSEEGYLTSYTEEREGGRLRKYYRMTDKGRRELQRRHREWEVYTNAVERVIGGAGHVLAGV